MMRIVKLNHQGQPMNVFFPAVIIFCKGGFRNVQLTYLPTV